MRKVKLTELCSPKQWKTIPASFLKDSGFPVYGANGIIGYYDEYNHKEPVIALGCRGTCGNLNITEAMSYVTGNAMCLDNLANDVSIDYLYFCLRHFDFSKIISGSSQPQITRQGLEKVELNIHNHAEQLLIVKILNHIEKLIIHYNLQLRKLDELAKARFVEMFQNKDFPKRKGSSLFVLASGKANPTANLSDQYTHPCYGGNGITGYSSTFLCEKETIVIGRVGVYCGCVHMAPPYSWVTDNAIYVKSLNGETINLRFLYHQFAFIDFHRFANAGCQPKITQKPILEQEYIVPNVALQNDFLSFIAQLDKSRFAVLKSKKASLRMGINIIDTQTTPDLQKEPECIVVRGGISMDEETSKKTRRRHSASCSAPSGRTRTTTPKKKAELPSGKGTEGQDPTFPGTASSANHSMSPRYLACKNSPISYSIPTRSR